MKQRIRVVAIIKKDDEILLMKRNFGRSEDVPVWELPTGKIQFGEQPEEAMSRSIYDYLGNQTDSIKLKDVVTFLALEGASQLGNLYIVYEVNLKKDSKIQAKDRYSAYKFVKISEANGLRLEDASLSVLSLEDNKVAPSYKSAVNGATVFTDGGSRGNPGPSGIGWYIVGEDGSVIDRGGEFIGYATSRAAEYYALKKGIERAKDLSLKSVRFISDNLMMVNQMNGVYQVKNQDLVPIYDDIQKMLKDFEAVAFVHVNREQNTEADAEVNLAINRILTREKD